MPVISKPNVMAHTHREAQGRRGSSPFCCQKERSLESAERTSTQVTRRANRKKRLTVLYIVEHPNQEGDTCIDWTSQYCWTNGWNCLWRGHSVYQNRPLIPQKEGNRPKRSSGRQQHRGPAPPMGVTTGTIMQTCPRLARQMLSTRPTARVALHTTRVSSHTTRVSLHTARSSLYTARGSRHITRVLLHTATLSPHAARVLLRTARVSSHTARVPRHPAGVPLHTPQQCL